MDFAKQDSDLWMSKKLKKEKKEKQIFYESLASLMWVTKGQS